MGGGGGRRQDLHGLARVADRAVGVHGKVQHLRLPRPRPRARGDPGMPGEKAKYQEEEMILVAAALLIGFLVGYKIAIKDIKDLGERKHDKKN